MCSHEKPFAATYYCSFWLKLLFIAKYYCYILLSLAILIERLERYGFEKWLRVRFDRDKSHTFYMARSPHALFSDWFYQQRRRRPNKAGAILLPMFTPSWIIQMLRKCHSTCFRNQLHLWGRRFQRETVEEETLLLGLKLGDGEQEMWKQLYHKWICK